MHQYISAYYITCYYATSRIGKYAYTISPALVSGLHGRNTMEIAISSVLRHRHGIGLALKTEKLPLECATIQIS